MLRQCWAIILLKWTILKHTFTTGRLIGTVLGAILVLVMVGVALGGSAFAFFAGWQFMDPVDRDTMFLLAVLDGMVLLGCFMALWGLLLEVQRADIIDVKKMLHYPVSLPMIHAMNFVSSLFSPGFIIAAPVVTCFLVGLSLARGPWMLLGIPLAWMLLLMVAAWAYYVRGLFAMLMENKRRWRVVMGALPFAFFAIAYSPMWGKPVFRAIAPHLPASLRAVEPEALLTTASAVIPPFWFPYGVAALEKGQFLAALAAFAGLTALTSAGLWLGYRAMRNHCLEVSRATRATKRSNKPRDSRTVFTARGVPLLAEDTAAMVRAAWLHYYRLPNLRTVVGVTLLMAVVLCFMSGALKGDGSNGRFLMGALALIPYMNLNVFLLNVFGADYGGFRCQVLTPVPRHRILLSRNLVLAPIYIGMSVTLTITVGFLTGMTWTGMITWVILAPAAYLFMVCLGNYGSVFMPYGFPRSALRRKKFDGNLLIATLLSMVSFVLLVGLCVSVASLDWLSTGLNLGAIPWSAIVAVVLLAVLGAIYPYALRSAGRQLQQRELSILETITRDRE